MFRQSILDAGELCSCRAISCMKASRCKKSEGEILFFELGFQRTITLGLFRLQFHRANLPLDLAHDVIYAQKILLGALEFLFGDDFAAFIFARAGGFFDQGAPVLRFGIDQLVDFALLDDGVGFAADAGAQETIRPRLSAGS